MLADESVPWRVIPSTMWSMFTSAFRFHCFCCSASKVEVGNVIRNIRSPVPAHHDFNARCTVGSTR